MRENLGNRVPPKIFYDMEVRNFDGGRKVNHGLVSIYRNGLIP